MTQRTIRLEVEAKVKAWAAAQSPAIPIAYENMPYTKTDATFIELYIIPATTVNQTVSASRKTLTGLIQFLLFDSDTDKKTISSKICPQGRFQAVRQI